MAIETGIMIVFIEILNLGNAFSKIIVAIIVVILNYLLSKLMIFN